MLLWFFFAYLAAAMLLDSDNDTVHVSGAAFVLAATMCGVAFSYGRVLPTESKLRAEVVFAGERLFQAMSMFLLASLVKYGSIDIPGHLEKLASLLEVPPMPGRLYGMAFTGLAFIMFLFGLVFFQSGYRTIAGVSVQRMSRRKAAPDLFISENGLRLLLEEMDREDISRGL